MTFREISCLNSTSFEKQLYVVGTQLETLSMCTLSIHLRHFMNEAFYYMLFLNYFLTSYFSENSENMAKHTSYNIFFRHMDDNSRLHIHAFDSLS